MNTQLGVARDRWVEKQRHRIYGRLIGLEVVLIKHKPAHVDRVNETLIIAVRLLLNS